MTKEEWHDKCDEITNLMVQYVRPYVSPLFITSSSPRKLIGSGSFIVYEENNAVLTCEHVSGSKKLDFFLRGNTAAHELGKIITSCSKDLDLELIGMKPDNWCGVEHSSKSLTHSLFAEEHSPKSKEEVMFIQGFSDENSGSGYGDEIPISTGLATQVQASTTSNIKNFEIPWSPNKETYPSGTESSLRERHVHKIPSGMSGTLVWNTRYLEVSRQGIKWKPEHARITGIVHRWDKDTKSLICLKVEKILPFVFPAKSVSR